MLHKMKILLPLCKLSFGVELAVMSRCDHFVAQKSRRMHVLVDRQYGPHAKKVDVIIIND
uniref:Secreted protein n=1 Tax=Candidozyma auris TaxID=498019 RepID=A0A0L0P1D8_CANAR